LAQIALGFPGAIYPFEEFLGLLQIVDVVIYLAAFQVIFEDNFECIGRAGGHELLLVGQDFIGFAQFLKYTIRGRVRDGWVGLLVVSNWEVEVAGVALRFPFLQVVLRVGTLVIVVAMSSTFCGRPELLLGVAIGKRFEGRRNFVPILSPPHGVTASEPRCRYSEHSCVDVRLLLVLCVASAIKSLWHLSDDKGTARMLN
jgi:hypothetical protein